ncbi:MAG: hypothetical protein IT327_07675 [Anaerolineae bacterium]|nr:hypothetical protein [Anaerolineae bacterium]
MSAKDDYFDRDETAVLRRIQPYNSEWTKTHIVRTPHGYVICTTHVWPKGGAITHMEFVSSGRLCTRTWKREWRPRTITSLAREFVADVVKRPENL